MSMHVRRGPRRLTTAVLVLLLLQVGFAGAATAHNSLISTAPADGGQMETAPAAVMLTFDGPVSPDFNQVIVTGPDGSAWNTGEPQVDGPTVTQPLIEQGPGGTYAVAWRVVSADGHPNRRHL